MDEQSTPPAKRGRGRPDALTPEIQAEILKAISLGNYRQVAAQYAGIPIRTFARWCALGKQQTKGKYYNFWQALLKAERQAEILTVAQVRQNHGEWWLERKFHERWGRKDRVEVTGKGGGPVQVNSLILQRCLSDDQTRELLAALSERLAITAGDVEPVVSGAAGPGEPVVNGQALEPAEPPAA